MATTVVMPSPRQREDVYEAFTRLSESCDNFDRDAAITACKDGIRASKVILALLGGSDPDASYASSSEESFTGPGASVDSSDGEDSDGEPGGLHDADDDGGDSSDDDDDDDGGGGADDYDPGDCDDDDGGLVSCSDSTSGDEDTSSDELVADYAGLTDASRHCDRCASWGHTNQYCPELPARKRRRL